MATYSLQVKNDSPCAGYICLYTDSPETRAIQQNLRSLAWFSKAMNPNGQVKFTWDLDFSFAWAESGVLVPGVHFEAGEIIKADPQKSDLNKALFSKQNDAYLFGNPADATDPSKGALSITTDATIPNGMASVGIGINGKAALAVSATPNYQFTFIPKIKYYVAFGTFKEGVVLDLNSMVKQVQEIAFQPNVFSMQLSLKADNTWSTPAPV
jgi:hypothetical protein